MSKQNGLSMLDSGQVIQEVHNESEKALDVISANSLVPKRYGKVELEYIQSADGTCKAVSTAKYYSNGAYQSQTAIVHGDVIGTPHKTTVNFFNRTPSNLANNYLNIFDSNGSVLVWFNLDGTGTPPDSEDRLIEVSIASSDTEPQLAQKLNAAINTDISFFSVVQDVMAMIVNYESGIRQNSVDINSGLVLKNIQGVDTNRLDGKFFYLNNVGISTQYYVWYNVDNLSTDPMVPGRTGIQVNIPYGASEELVSLNTAFAIAQTTDFTTENFDNKICINNKYIGTADIIKDVNSAFSFKINTKGMDRELIAQLVMTYDVNNDLVSVERL
jgi:hypothetical protein